MSSFHEAPKILAVQPPFDRDELIKRLAYAIPEAIEGDFEILVARQGSEMKVAVRLANPCLETINGRQELVFGFDRISFT